MPWGARLIPVDELQRLLAERRQPARKQPRPAPPGRPTALPPEVADRIRTARAAGRSLAQIARELNATGTPTAHGGAQWWLSEQPELRPRHAPPTRLDREPRVFTRTQRDRDLGLGL